MAHIKGHVAQPIGTHATFLNRMQKKEQILVSFITMVCTAKHGNTIRGCSGYKLGYENLEGRDVVEGKMGCRPSIFFEAVEQTI